MRAIKAAALCIGVLTQATVTWACPEFNRVRTLEAMDYESITVSTTAIGPTVAKIKEANGAEKDALVGQFSLEGADLRFRIDGTNPTASEGHLVSDGDTFTVCGATNLQALKMIRDDASDVTVKATYYKGLQ